MDSGNLTPNILIYVVVVLVVFLICREITCWYFKINKTITVLEEIRDLLQYQNQGVKGENKIEPYMGDINELQK